MSSETDPERPGWPLTDEGRARLRELVRATTSTWRMDAFIEYLRIEQELEHLTFQQTGDPGKTQCEAARKSLDGALIAMAPRRVGLRTRHWRPRERLALFFSGARVEETWSGLHGALECMLGVFAEDVLKATKLPGLKYLVELHLDQKDSRREIFLASLEQIAKGAIGPTERIQLEDIRKAVDETSDLYQRDTRAFRNRLVIASGLFSVVAVILAVWSAFEPNVASVCASHSASSMSNLCPGGTSSPAGWNVAVVELLGAMGGLLSAIIPLRTSERVPGPYRVFDAQIALKVTSGAISALLGLLLLNAGLVPGLTLEGSNALGYAALFGFSQQLLTMLADSRADELAKSAPTQKQTAPTG